MTDEPCVEAHWALPRRNADVSALVGTVLDGSHDGTTREAAKRLSAAWSRQERLLELIGEVSAADALRPLTSQLLDALLELSGAERGFLLVARGGQLGLEAARSFEGQALDTEYLEVSQTILGLARAQGEPLLVRDVLREPRLRTKASVVRAGVHSVLVLPFQEAGRVFALAYLDSQRASKAIGAEAAVASRTLARCLQPALLAKVLNSPAPPTESTAFSPLSSFVGEDSGFRASLDQARRAASSEAPVLFLGETGTGKDLLARALHDSSARANAPFGVVNCAALPSSLAESELFGHERGAFTGATGPAPGRIRLAAGGTLFLDEVGDLAPDVQAKLLRFLQSGEVQPVGGQPVVVDVRVVAATHRDLSAHVAEGLFRRDLLHRLDVITIRVPPLRERGADVLLLAEHFLAQFSRAEGRALTGFSPETEASLLAYRFPGNVRELENAIRRAVIFTAGPLVLPCDLPPSLQASSAAPPTAPRTGEELRAAKAAARKRAEDAVERRFLDLVLRRANGNVAAASRESGINRTQLHRLVARHQLDLSAYRARFG